jgi:hypothetical protein
VIRRTRGILKRKPADIALAAEWPGHKRTERKLEARRQKPAK